MAHQANVVLIKTGNTRDRRIQIPPLSRGSYAYKFVVDQARWTHDVENADVMEDGYDGFHSVLKI